MKSKPMQWVLAAALCFSLTAFAQTPAPPPGGEPPPVHAEGPCRQDAERLCPGVQRGGGRIIQCLKQHEAEVSPACKEKWAERRARHHGGGAPPPGGEPPPGGAPPPAH